MRRNLFISIFITVFFSVFTGINYYIGWNGWIYFSTVFKTIQANPILYWSLFWIVAYSYVLGRMGRHFYDLWIFRALMWIGAYWMGAMIYLILLLPIANVVEIFISSLVDSREESVRWMGTAVLTILGVIMIWGSRNAWSPVARRYEIHLHKRHGNTPSEPIRIIVASDFHLGTIVGRRHLQRWVKRVNAFQPDLVLLPGDLVDDDIRPFVKNRMDEIFREIRSRWGIIAITGNHDPFKDVNQGFMQAMENAGIKMLLDEHMQIADRLIVVGREERSVRGGWPNSRKPLSQLMESLDQNLPILVMDHQPLGFAEAAALGADIMLSGHTHRGQLAPGHLITRRIFDLDYGYRQFGNMHAIVSSGYGTWGPPLRIGSRCEYIELILT